MTFREYKSKMGYRDDSPFVDEAALDIFTPNGVIDMSNTGRTLLANGRVLPPYSGLHQFDTNVVRETPIDTHGHLGLNRKEGAVGAGFGVKFPGGWGAQVRANKPITANPYYKGSYSGMLEKTFIGKKGSLWSIDVGLGVEKEIGKPSKKVNLSAKLNFQPGGSLPIAQTGNGVSHMDSVRHQVGKIPQYEEIRGGRYGNPLKPWIHNSELPVGATTQNATDWIMDNVVPQVNKLMPNASAMEKGEVTDFVYNSGFDKKTNTITKDPRGYAIQEYYRKYDPSKLDTPISYEGSGRGWSGRKGLSKAEVDKIYGSTVGTLSENDRRVIMNLGRDWYMQGIERGPGSINENLEAYKNTWYGRIGNMNTYEDFNSNWWKKGHPDFRGQYYNHPDRRQQGGSLPKAQTGNGDPPDDSKILKVDKETGRPVYTFPAITASGSEKGDFLKFYKTNERKFQKRQYNPYYDKFSNKKFHVTPEARESVQKYIQNKNKSAQIENFKELYRAPGRVMAQLGEVGKQMFVDPVVNTARRIKDDPVDLAKRLGITVADLLSYGYEYSGIPGITPPTLNTPEINPITGQEYFLEENYIPAIEATSVIPVGSVASSAVRTGIRAGALKGLSKAWYPRTGYRAVPASGAPRTGYSAQSATAKKLNQQRDFYTTSIDDAEFYATGNLGAKGLRSGDDVLFTQTKIPWFHKSAVKNKDYLKLKSEQYNKPISKLDSQDIDVDEFLLPKKSSAASVFYPNKSITLKGVDDYIRNISGVIPGHVGKSYPAKSSLTLPKSFFWDTGEGKYIIDQLTGAKALTTFTSGGSLPKAQYGNTGVDPSLLTTGQRVTAEEHAKLGTWFQSVEEDNKKERHRQWLADRLEDRKQAEIVDNSGFYDRPEFTPLYDYLNKPWTTDDSGQPVVNQEYMELITNQAFEKAMKAVYEEGAALDQAKQMDRVRLSIPEPSSFPSSKWYLGDGQNLMGKEGPGTLKSDAFAHIGDLQQLRLEQFFINPQPVIFGDDIERPNLYKQEGERSEDVLLKSGDPWTVTPENTEDLTLGTKTAWDYYRGAFPPDLYNSIRQNAEDDVEHMYWQGAEGIRKGEREFKEELRSDDFIPSMKRNLDMWLSPFTYAKALTETGRSYDNAKDLYVARQLGQGPDFNPMDIPTWFIPGNIPALVVAGYHMAKGSLAVGKDFRAGFAEEVLGMPYRKENHPDNMGMHMLSSVLGAFMMRGLIKPGWDRIAFKGESIPGSLGARSTRTPLGAYKDAPASSKRTEVSRVELDKYQGMVSQLPPTKALGFPRLEQLAATTERLGLPPHNPYPIREQGIQHTMKLIPALRRISQKDYTIQQKNKEARNWGRIGG